MRLVVDTNVVVSGSLWRGVPRRILDAAQRKDITLFTSPDLLAELEDVLGRGKFKRYLLNAGVDSKQLVSNYSALTTLVRPSEIIPVIFEDTDDNAVLACAIAAKAEFIVSGDSHLLKLGKYAEIRIVTPAECLKMIV